PKRLRERASAAVDSPRRHHSKVCGRAISEVTFVDLPEVPSGDGKTRRVGLSGAVASLVVAVPRVTRRVTGRRVRALGMNCLRVRGGAGLAPAAGLIRSLSAFSA